MLAVKWMVPVGPNGFPCKIDRYKTAITKNRINPLAISDRRWRCITVSGFLLARLLAKYFLVPKEFAGFGLQRNDPARLTLVSRSGEKHPVTPNNGSRPCVSRDGCLPTDVFLLAPFQGQILF